MSAYQPPKMTVKKITECLLDVTESPQAGHAYDFPVYYEKEDGTSIEYQIFSTDYFIEKIISLYYNRKMIVREDDPTYTFCEFFVDFRYHKNRVYSKMMFALMKEYDPYGNFDISEVLTNDQTTHAKGASYRDDYHNSDTKTITPFTKEKIETTPADVRTETTPMEVKVTTTPADEKTETTPMETVVTTSPFTSEKTTTTPHDAATTNLTSAFNSADAWSNASKSIQTGSTDVELTKTGNEVVNTTHNNTKETVLKTRNNTTETVETTHNNTKETVLTTRNDTKEVVEKTYEGNRIDSMAHSGYVDHTSEGSDTDTRNYTLRKYGNDGKLLPPVELMRELENIRINLADMAIDEFIDRYTFYAEGGDF